MTTATLAKPVRDRAGRPHLPGEPVILLGEPRPRSGFDARKMLRVKLADGSELSVFEDEIAPPSQPM